MQAEISKNNPTNSNQQGNQALNTTDQAQKLKLDLNSWESFEDLILQGGMGGFFTAEQVEEIMESITQQLPELVLPVETLGQSYENRDLKLHCFTKNAGNTTLEIESKNKAIAMATALHHSREPMSLSMLMFLLHRILVEYKKNNEEYVQLLNNNIFCTLPVVNIDSYNLIAKTWKETGKFASIRKNRHDNSTHFCPSDDLGVDLNRNYDYGWNINEIGSSPNPCQEDYRGATPFSEPETQAIKSFVDKYHTQLKVVMNFHAYGNLWILPFNCYPDDTPYRTPRIDRIYNDFKKNAKIPKNALIGNAIQTVDYLANGEASDWLLGTYGIISMSPEIGLHHTPDDKFFPSKQYIYPVVTGDYDGVFYMLSKLNPKFSLQDTTKTNFTSPYKKNVTFEIYNECYQNVSNLKIEVSFTLSGINEGFLSNTQVPRLSFIERNLDNAALQSRLYSLTEIQTEKKNSTAISYTASEEFDIGSWNYLRFTAVLPESPFDKLQVEVRILQDNKELFRGIEDYPKKVIVIPDPEPENPLPPQEPVNKKVSILVISIFLALGATTLIILITKCYLNARKVAKNQNIYGPSQQKGLEFAQIENDTESLDSSKA